MKTRIKKLLSSAGAVALIAGGLAVASATAAEAHTPQAAASCTGLEVNLTSYADQTPAHDAIYKTVPHHDLVTAAVKEVSHTEYVWTKTEMRTQKNSPGDGWVRGDKERHGDKYEWSKTTTQQAKTSPGYGWTRGDSVKVIDTAAQAAVYHDYTTQDLVKAATDAKANHVTVTVDGETATDQAFGSSFAQSYPSSDQYAAHVYTVNVTAWDSSAYDYAHTFNVDACKTDAAQPPATVTTTDWADSGVAVCGDTTVEQTRTVTTTPFKLIDHEWIAGDATSATETQTRDLSADELAALAESCTPPVVIPDKPDAIVTTTSTDATSCDDSTVTTTTLTVTTGWVYDEESNTWAQGPAESSEPVVTTRPATDAELADCPAVVIPPTEPPTPVETPVVPAPVIPAAVEQPAPLVDARAARVAAGKELAITGNGFPLAAGLVGLAALLAGIGALVVVGIRRRTA